MKYCSNCGSQIKEGADFCLNCGKLLKETSDENNKSLKMACVLIGLFVPVAGAVLYYSFKKTKPEVAKVANTWSWIGFLLYGIIYFIFLR